MQKCTKCDGIQTVEIPALGHAFAETWTVDENGHWHICTRDNCTAKSDEANHVDENKNHACDVCEKVVSECADEDNNHKCDTCGEKLSDCADDDNNHKCDTCGEKLSDCADTDNNHNCDTCGATVSDHTGGEATCQQKATCTICGNEYGEYGAHNYDETTWVKNTTNHWYACKTTGCTQKKNEAAHAFESGFCSQCDGYQSAVKNGDVYEISNAGQLFWFAQMVNGVSADGTAQNRSANAKLTADIDLGGKTWYPIGLYKDIAVAGGEEVTAQYLDTFNGNFHVVSNFTAKGNGSQGLLGYLSWKATVKNLGVKNATVQGWNVGAVSGFDGNLENCFAVNCTITGYSEKNTDSVKLSAVGGNTSPSNVMKNCFAYNCTLKVDERENGYYMHPVAGAYRNSKLTNSYYYEINTNKPFSSKTGATEKTKAQFASGEVAYLLNGSTSEGTLAWYQTIGTHEYPVFEGRTVYCDARYGSYCNATEHTGGTATCQQKATCTVCGNEYGNFAEHDYDETAWVKDETSHYYACKTTGCTQKKDEAAHTDVDKNHVCDDCGKTTEHTGGTVTCQQKAVCTICEQEYGNLAAHDYEWIKGKDGHYRRCKTENCTEEEPLTAHTFKDGICSACGDYDVYGTEDLSFAYYVRDQYYEVKKYRGSETDVVKTIVEKAFENTNIKSVFIPAGVTTTAYNGFAGCSSLERVTYGENSQLGAISPSMFKNCWRLTSFEIPGNVKTIYSSAFYGCSGIKSIEIPDSVTKICESAFYGCGLTSITFGENSRLTTIDNYGLSGIRKITSITIPDSVTTIGKDAFSGNYRLWSVTLGAGITESGLGENIFPESVHEIYNKSKLNLTAGSDDYKGIAKYAKLIITDGVSRIRTNEDGYTYLIVGDQGYLLNYNKTDSLDKITLPQTFEGKNYSIGGYAFAESSFDSFKFTEVVLPDNLISIGGYAFYGNQWLRYITIPSSVTSIGKWAFGSCGLKSVTIPQNVTSIGEYAFDANSFLESVTFETGSQLTSLGAGAFESCGYLKSITIPSGVTVINADTFNRCRNLSRVTLGDGVTSIGKSAFEECSALESITIPSDVTSIGKRAFAYSGLKSITIPSGVTVLEESIFYYCTKLESVTIGKDVTSIEKEAFNRCSVLKTINFAGTTEEWQGVTKGTDWQKSTGTFTVKCSDGDVAKEAV